MDAKDFGGRLALLDPAGLAGDQKAIYDRIKSSIIGWAERSGFEAMTEDGRLIGPFNPVLLSPGTASGFLDLQEAEQAGTSLTERVRQVVILLVGAVWRADYELYAHAAAARKAGLTETTIRSLTAGVLPDELSEQEELAGRFARQLSAEHRVEPELYRAAEGAFGTKGLVDIILLAGLYHIVCGLLTGFEIPRPHLSNEGAPQVGRQGKLRSARLSTVALFPKGSFLENLAVRTDNSVLITSMNTKELFYVAPQSSIATVEPVLLHSFDQLPTGVVEIEQDLFLICTSNIYTTHESSVCRLDLREWQPGSPVKPEMVFRFPEAARGLNGFCLLAPGVALVADCFAGLIWRLDMEPGGRNIQARVWLEHDSMGYFPGKLKPEQPGVNGVRYAARSNFLYYTATAKKLLMRVPVDPESLDSSGPPELVLAGRMGDDFCIDENAGVLYLATHRQNTIDRVALEPAENSGFTQNVAGAPFTEMLIGPSSGAWSRRAGDHGKVAFFICDGGTASPPPGGAHPAKLLRVEF